MRLGHARIGLLPLLGAALALGHNRIQDFDPGRLVFRPGASLELSSPAFAPNAFIPARYTCDGEDINPPLHIRGVTAEAKSLVLLVEDLDAPQGDLVHWLVWNMDIRTSAIAEDGAPRGAVQGKTDFDWPGFAAPCPDRQIHHYLFRLYSLDTVLPLAPTAGRAAVEKAMRGHVLDRSELLGLYKRLDPGNARGG